MPSSSAPHVPHEIGHFPSLVPDNTPLDSGTYIPDRALENLRNSMQEWTARAISGPVLYASSSEPPLSRKNVL